MRNVLVLPDVHGRKFWEKPCENIENYDKVIFLGDYFDPYGFEDIEIPDCIENFKKIIELKKNNNDKVVLLLGNHDMPYFSKTYFGFSWYHCRHSMIYHNDISKLFKENKELFQIAYIIDDILFTHAGVDSGWLRKVVKYDDDININKICYILNHLLDDKKGLEKLYCITRERGGSDRYGSCIWADVHDIMWDNENGELNNIKQIFGHTMQAFYDENRNIVFGDTIEFGNCKMVDTANPYELDIENFQIKKIPQ